MVDNLGQFFELTLVNFYYFYFVFHPIFEKIVSNLKLVIWIQIDIFQKFEFFNFSNSTKIQFNYAIDNLHIYYGIHSIDRISSSWCSPCVAKTELLFICCFRAPHVMLHCFKRCLILFFSRFCSYCIYHSIFDRFFFPNSNKNNIFFFILNDFRILPEYIIHVVVIYNTVSNMICNLQSILFNPYEVQFYHANRWEYKKKLSMRKLIDNHTDAQNTYYSKANDISSFFKIKIIFRFIVYSARRQLVKQIVLGYMRIKYIVCWEFNIVAIAFLFFQLMIFCSLFYSTLVKSILVDLVFDLVTWRFRVVHHKVWMCFSPRSIISMKLSNFRNV